MLICIVMQEHPLIISIMETNKKPDKKHGVKLSEMDHEKEQVRKEQNFEKNSSSVIATKHEKKHGRTHHSFGDGHEPGTIPGTGV